MKKLFLSLLGSTLMLCSPFASATVCPMDDPDAYFEANPSWGINGWAYPSGVPAIEFCRPNVTIPAGVMSAINIDLPGSGTKSVQMDLTLMYPNGDVESVQLCPWMDGGTWRETCDDDYGYFAIPANASVHISKVTMFVTSSGAIDIWSN